jgi:eukaryotic-like serine/threonine-protein kinase
LGFVRCCGPSRLQDRARAILERALGPKHPNLAIAIGRLGRAQVCAGELELAGHHLERARALLERALGPRSLEVFEPLLGLGELELARGHPEEALPHLERALELAPPADRPQVQLTLARALQATKAGRPRARELATEALEHYQQVGNRKGAAEASRWLAAQGAR